jgi:hypothetical protein
VYTTDDEEIPNYLHITWFRGDEHAQPNVRTAVQLAVLSPPRSTVPCLSCGEFYTFTVGVGDGRVGYKPISLIMAF